MEQNVIQFLSIFSESFENNIISKISLGVHDFIHIDDFIDGIFSVLYSEKEIIKAKKIREKYFEELNKIKKWKNIH